MTLNTSLGLAVVALLGAILSFLVDSYSLLVLTLFCLSALVATGLNILIGLSGQISFGHVAFYAIGAYCASLMTMAGVPFGLALLSAALLTGVCGGLLAIPALRVQGPYLAMVTIAFAFVIHHGLMEWKDVTGGSNGLIGVPMPNFGVVSSETGLALTAVLLMVAGLWFYQRLALGPWGKAMRAAKGSDTAARSIGINLMVPKAWAFALSAAMAGSAGALIGPLMMFISPSTFPFSQSILFVLAVIVGGSGFLFGPVIGAAVIVLLPELLSGVAEYRLLVFAAFLLAVLWAAPSGCIGLILSRVRRSEGELVPARADTALLESVLNPSRGYAGGLSVDNIGITFGGVKAVQGVSFTAPEGKVTSIIGPNGAGKTTALNLISGFYTPDTGSVKLEHELAGRNAWDIARAGIARTYQTTQLFEELSVMDNLLIAMRKGELSHPLAQESDRSRDIVRNLLAFTGYRGELDIAAGNLPHVDRRLVEIARALAMAPRVLLLDEPAAGLSRSETDQLGELLKAIAEFGIAVIIVEHDMPLVMSVSDSILVLDSGKPIALGTPAEIRDNPQVIAAYLGGTDYEGRPRQQAWSGPADHTLFVKDLQLDYGAAPVVFDVNLVVKPGECVAILGANGAGKSSIMRALAGLHRPVQGSILLNNESIDKLDASGISSQGLALVPEGRQVFPELSVRDNLLMGAFQRDFRKEELSKGEGQEQAVEAVLQRFPRLRDRIDQPAGLLSGGEQQMVAIGRALMAKPTLLLLDEPSLGLAPAMIRELFEVLASLRDEGITILLVDQMANLALTLADRAYLLETGRIVKAGSAEELRKDKALEAAYLGSGDKERDKEGNKEGDDAA